MSRISTSLTPRLVNLSVFVFCAAMIGIALYMEQALMLEPCPLCIMQRVFFIATGLVTLAAAIHNPMARGRKIYGALSALMAVVGSGFAIQQIHLQMLPPDQVPVCEPSLTYMWEADFPLKRVAKALFYGDGSCAEITWRDPLFNFFTIPQLALLGFAMLAATCVWQTLRKS